MEVSCSLFVEFAGCVSLEALLPVVQLFAKVFRGQSNCFAFAVSKVGSCTPGWWMGLRWMRSGWCGGMRWVGFLLMRRRLGGRSSLSNRIANSRGSAANKKAYPGAKALGYLEAKTTADATTTAKTKCGGPSTAPFTVRL
jgi:hypothetical protein